MSAIGVKRTCLFALQMSANDPKRTCRPLSVCYHVVSPGTGERMRRREFIGLFCSAALAWPVGVRAQQVGKVPRVGFLGPDRATMVQVGYYQAFVAQLEKNGAWPFRWRG